MKRIPASLFSVLSVVLALSIPALPGCGAPQACLRIRTDPPGADVSISRRGEKAYEGNLGPFRGDWDAEPFVEDFRPLGEAPVEYRSPLKEREAGASAPGLGVERVRRYRDAIVRVEKPGFEPVERRVALEDGEVDLEVRLDPERGAP